jgi:site-specific DNA recombinase
VKYDDDHRANRVVLYARVSSEEQAKNGYSLPGQLRRLRLHALEAGHEVLAEAVDDGYPGDSLWRPGLEEARRVVQGGGVDLVLATERDRVARKRGYVFMLEEEFREHGCALRTLEDKDDDSAGERLLRAIKDEFAEYEHAKIAERTFSKKLEKARGGEVIAGRTPNYGFRYNERRNGYVLDEERMPLVRRAFQMIGAEGRTAYAVLRWLEGADPRGPTGKGWNAPFLRKMVFNDVYRPHSYEEARALVPPEASWRLAPGERYGIWWFNRTRFEPKRTPPEKAGDFRRKYRPKAKPRGEWIGVPVCDPGIPPEVVDAARARMGQNRAPSKNGRRFWELSGGIVRCAGCGYVMGTTSSGTPTNDYYYYRCRSRHNVKSGCGNGRGVRADALEREVWATVSGELRRPDRLLAGLEKMIESERRTVNGGTEEEAARWSSQAEKARAKRSRYQEQEAEGLMTREELRARLTELDGVLRTAEAELENLRRREERIGALERSGEELLGTYAELVPEELEDVAPEERRHLYLLLQIEVWVPKEGEITIRLPFSPDGEFCRRETASCSRL